MNQRIVQIMKWQGMTQNEFAVATGISAASLSSIINGHNNPTMRTLLAVKERFPEVSLDWLCLGTGSMLQASGSTSGSINEAGNSDSSQDKKTDVTETSNKVNVEPTLFDSQNQLRAAAATPQGVQRGQKANQQMADVSKNSDKHQRRIKEIRIYFDDETYETFTSRV